MNKEAPIGVIDSGVGGLTVLRTLQQKLPEENFIYLGDTARTPYGTRPEKQVRQFVDEMLSWLERRQVKMVVIACNTITVLGIDTLQKDHPYALIGMSKGETLVADSSKNKKIGVFATPFTVSTGAHEKAIKGMLPDADVYYQACPDFVPLIEGEQFESVALTEAVKVYAAPMKQAGVDSLLLSCTHYPFIKEQIEAELGTEVKVLDPAESTAENVKLWLEQNGLLRTGKSHTVVGCTADLERVQRLAGRMIKADECEFQLIDLTK